MHDVVDVLRTLPDAVTPAPAGAEVVAADVARGHRALSRRRRNRIAVSGLAVVAVAAVAVSVTQIGSAGSRPSLANGSGTTTQQATRIQLVAFTGTQPAGFRVQTIPAGWHVISSNSVEFVVAPPGDDSAGPGPAGVHGAGAGSVSYEGRIAVMLQGQSELSSDAPVTKVSINGRDGVLSKPVDGKALWLIFPDAAGHKVLVQVPVSIGLTTDQIVAFAKGITVTSEAQAGVG
jgi:hypothetical protein